MKDNRFPATSEAMYRRNLLARLTRARLKTMRPNCGRYSGQQVAYAKGQAWKLMQAIGY